MEKKPIPLTDTGHIIETSCLTKDYGFGRGVFDVNLHVNEGEVFGFLGPNGAGKSTTIRHLMGFSKPDKGSTKILGRETFHNYDKILSHVGYLILLNVGAFLVLLALSGLCFFTSCLFDRSKRSMAIGGGLSIFALVAAMLGLFGSPVIPSVVRLDALNNFNYATIISLFDVISIIDGTDAYVLKFIVLGISGLLGYVIGSIHFTRKDLPL